MRKMGKLHIYVKTADKVEPDNLIRRIFPKTIARHIIAEAKKDGLMNASAYQTHFGYSNGGQIKQYSAESDNAEVVLCVELIDTRERLENFFKKHKKLLQHKVAIYKEVEFWETE